MNSRLILGAVGLAGVAIVLGQVDVDAFSGDGLGKDAVAGPSSRHGEFVPAGGHPDVYTLFINGYANWIEGEYRAFSVGTTSCNQGSVPLDWHANDNRHPVIGQNMFRYRLDDKGHGRFEQIGQSWLKHGFCALDQSGCGDCQGTGCITLGVNCSDPYTATRNGSQSDAGPKYEVNATTGDFPFPPANPPWSGSIDRRLKVAVADVLPEMNPGALYFFEAQYVHPQDNPASTPYGAFSNNASYRQANIGPEGEVVNFAEDTVVQKPAILAWAEIDNQVSMQRVIFPTEGLVRVASRAYANGDGTWDYEYAVHNLDFDRSIGGFSVPIPDSVTVTDIEFRNVEYHSGELFSNAPWTSLRSAGRLSWATESHEANENAGAIRWGNMFNFRFTADGPPIVVGAGGRVDVFKPGTPSSKNVTVRVPGEPVICRGDINGNLEIDFQDLLTLLLLWGPCSDCYVDIDEDGDVDFDDLTQLLFNWGPCFE